MVQTIILAGVVLLTVRKQKRISLRNMRNVFGALEVWCIGARWSTEAKPQWLGVRGDVLAVQSPWRSLCVLRGQFCRETKEVRELGRPPASQTLTFDCPSLRFAGC